MKKRTHYDNLKVSRDAPQEVIRAAYRSLSNKYHPDKNPGSAEAEMAMKLINEAYEILSNPVKRKKHDEWIDNNTMTSSSIVSDDSDLSKYTLSWEQYIEKYNVSRKQLEHAINTGQVKSALKRGVLYIEDVAFKKRVNDTVLFVLVLLAIFVVVILFGNHDKGKSEKDLVQQSKKGHVSENMLKPEPLPITGVISNTKSESLVTAPLKINTSNGYNYFIKIKNIKTNKTVISAFINSGDSLDLRVPLGVYRVFYASGREWYGFENLFGEETIYNEANKDLNFQIQDGQISGYVLTLYKVSNGNLTTKNINKSQF